MAKSSPPDVLKLFDEAYSKSNGYKCSDPSSEWFGLTCQIARRDGAWSVKVANSATAPFMDFAFEGTGATVEAAFGDALQKLISMGGRPPLPKTPRELEEEKWLASLKQQKADVDAAKERT